MNNLLQIKDLRIEVEDKVILDSCNLEVGKGEIHVLMGPNGVGKSTLVSSVMGDPAYEVTKGQILFEGQDITGLAPDERAARGIFMSFQNPEEVPGVTMEDFLRLARASVKGEKQKIMAFKKDLYAKMDALEMDRSYAGRYLNVGFSGGEKKKAEILQLLMLDPKLAFLDETDSGLDVDAVRTVTKGIRGFHNEENSLVIITHNAKILEGLKIDKVHVVGNGRIVKSGGPELISLIADKGFQSLVKEDS